MLKRVFFFILVFRFLAEGEEGIGPAGMDGWMDGWMDGVGVHRGGRINGVTLFKYFYFIYSFLFVFVLAAFLLLLLRFLSLRWKDVWLWLFMMYG